MKFSVLALAIQAIEAANCPLKRQYNSDHFIHPTTNFESGSAKLGQHVLASAVAYVEVDYDKVEQDILKMFKTSQDFWPADFGNYAPLFIRLAWHCAGSYRKSDGRGGCDGARIRFDPEASWADNTNLDKAVKLLKPVKDQNPSISWGDLIALTGDTAIKSMGGPSIGFCGGRVDDDSGAASLLLGPSKEQEQLIPCETQGDCKFPLGPTTIGLIYVNPEGPMGEPIPEKSAPQIREVFSRMGMGDSETVALTGGGHSFGKTHGACPDGPGKCGTGPTMGIGNNTFTSGFEGPWTLRPTEWTNEYFQNLLNSTFEVFKGPGGHNQWKPSSGQPYRMLTADLAFTKDPIYLELVKKYAANVKDLEADFAPAWYKLMNGDMGPAYRCKGKRVPPPQPFQLPVPVNTKKVDFNPIKDSIKALFNGTTDPSAYVTLAYQCASTYRATDYAGGCNGARLRFAPVKDFADNKGIAEILATLDPIKQKFPDATYADLIVYAGSVALESAGLPVDFKSGRGDITAPQPEAERLAPRQYYVNQALGVIDNSQVMGLTVEEYVALLGRLRNPGQHTALGYTGSYTNNVSKVSNEYFTLLLSETWEKVSDREYKSSNKPIYMTSVDVSLLSTPALKTIVEKYAAQEDLFKTTFAQAWVKLMNADLPPVGDAGSGVTSGVVGFEIKAAMGVLAVLSLIL